MDSSQAYIRDIESLYQMKDTFGYCADSMLKLLGAVDSYFNNVLASLQEAVDKIKEQLDKANDYHHKPSGLTSPGGEALIHCLATDTCQKADEKLVNIAEKLTEFASFQILEPGTEVRQEFRNEHRNDEDKPLDEEEKEKAMKNAFEDVRKEQELDSSYYHVADANGIMVCPVCGRPIALCVCKKC